MIRTVWPFGEDNGRHRVLRPNGVIRGVPRACKGVISP